MGAPIQGTGETPDQLTATIFQSRTGQSILSNGIEQQAIMDIQVRNSLKNIEDLLKALVMHMEILNGENVDVYR